MAKKQITVGRKYNALLNGQKRVLEVLEYDGEYYGIRWDDGDEEWACLDDLKRWIGERF